MTFHSESIVPSWPCPEHDIGAGHEASFLRELGDKSHTHTVYRPFPLDFSMHLRKAPFYSPRGCRFKLLLLLFAYTMISARHRFRCWSEFPIVSQKAYTVYICGYNFSRLAGVLFPDAEIKRWREHGLSYPSDVLLASGYHCSGFSSYHGKILYVDGENGVLPTQFEGMPHLFYLGPSTPKNHQGPSLQLFHVAHTTLFHPYDSVDFFEPESR